MRGAASPGGVVVKELESTELRGLKDILAEGQGTEQPQFGEVKIAAPGPVHSNYCNRPTT